MQTYRRSGSGLAWSRVWHVLPQCPGYGHWVSHRRVACALGIGGCPPLPPPDLNFGFGTCQSLGLRLSASGSRPGLAVCAGKCGLRLVCACQVGARPACVSERAALLLLGMSQGRRFVPSLLRWGFWCMPRCGFGLCPPLFGRPRAGLGFVCTPPVLPWPCGAWSCLGFPLTPTRGVSFPRMGCVAAICGAGGPSLVLGAYPARCGGPSSTWVVVRPCFSWRVVPSAGKGFVGVAMGGGFPPLFFLFSSFSGGEPLVGRGGGRGCRLVAWRSVSSAPSRASQPFVGLFFFRAPLAGGMPLSQQGCVPACPGCLFL